MLKNCFLFSDTFYYIYIKNIVPLSSFPLLGRQYNMNAIVRPCTVTGFLGLLQPNSKCNINLRPFHILENP